MKVDNFWLMCAIYLIYSTLIYCIIYGLQANISDIFGGL